MRTKLFVVPIAIVAVALLLPLTGVAQTVNIDNGVSGSGHLDVNVDAYGAYGNFNAAYFDNFEPPTGGSSNPAFTAGFRLFSGTDKVLLSDMPEWENVFLGTETWVTDITSPVSSDGTTATSSFSVCTAAGAPLLDFDVTQTATAPAAGIAVLVQIYEITNVSGGAIDFSMNRVLDSDLVWDGDFLSDHVAVSIPLDFVSTHEPGSSTQAMALTSGRQGVAHDSYWGSKNTHVPTDGPPAFGFGTDIILWNEDGLPATWVNYVAFVGYDTAGDSGLNSNDGHIGLDWALSLEDGASTTLDVRTVYGSERFCVVGDVNGDGSVTLTDVGPFVDTLTSSGYSCEADVNQDNVVDLTDVAPFVTALGG